MSDVEGIERCERNGVAGYATEEPTNERFEGHAVGRGEFVVADLGELVLHVLAEGSLVRDRIGPVGGRSC